MEPILAHVDNTDNKMKAQTVDALYLRPSGSITGGFYASDINSGKRIHRKSATATATPLTKILIQRVTRIGEADKMPRGVLFGDAEGITTILDLDVSPEDLNTEDFFQHGNKFRSRIWGGSGDCMPSPVPLPRFLFANHF